jgi:hypothetical protein
MRKAAIAIICILALSVILYGCAKTEPQNAVNTPEPSFSPTAEVSHEAKPETSELTSTKPAEISLEPSQQTDNALNIPVEETPIDVSGITIGEGGTFYLGQPFDNVIEKLGELGIDILSQIEITNEPEAWDWGDTVLGTSDFTFWMDETVYTIQVDWNSGIPTIEGLKAGDTLEKMKELYGTDYSTYAYGDNGTVYEYTIGDHYLQVFTGNYLKVFEDNDNILAHDWGISLYKFNK